MTEAERAQKGAEARNLWNDPAFREGCTALRNEALGVVLHGETQELRESGRQMLLALDRLAAFFKGRIADGKAAVRQSARAEGAGQDGPPAGTMEVAYE